MANAYERIAEDLREAIRAGQYRPGDRLPSEAELKKRYPYSAPTIRHALALVEAEGLIERRQGLGSFVRKPRRLVHRSNERHQWEKDRARAPLDERRRTGATERDTGLELDDLVFHAQYREVPADADLARAFDVPEGTTLVERNYRTRYAQEAWPFNRVRSYLVRDMVAANPDLLDDKKEPWPGGTMNQLMTVGIELGKIVERVTARPPIPEETEELGLPRGTAVLVIRKVAHDVNGRVVEVSDVILPGDRTELEFTTPLERW